MSDNQLTNFIFCSQKHRGSDAGLIPVCPSLTPDLQSFIREGGFCTVLDQPIPLGRLILKNLDPIHVTGTCPHAFEHLQKHHLNALNMWQWKDKTLFAHKPLPGVWSMDTIASSTDFTPLLFLWGMTYEANTDITTTISLPLTVTFTYTPATVRHHPFTPNEV